MSGQQMSEAPWAVDATGGYYPLRPLDKRFRETLALAGGPAPSEATHYTWDPATGQIVDWLREVAYKSSRGRPSEDPESDLFPESMSVEGERARYPGIGLYVRSGYEVIEQVAP